MAKKNTITKEHITLSNHLIQQPGDSPAKSTEYLIKGTKREVFLAHNMQSIGDTYGTMTSILQK